ncbi:diguanylate cyclase (GGDEF)-like protein [Pleionea mediterranea]|uniref:Diguanylate cyclase (GGDEF)-like protein n=2 Tax=Pleionea mediterranea TaxID=523701 RepID=A0A316F8S8_9GAMM|nr:diguanylate cyclase (GGDEF)-like protein [Pleionea mediterranea]
MPSRCRVIFSVCAISALLCMTITARAAELSKSQQKYLKDIAQIRLCVGPNSMPLEDIVDGQHIGMNAEYIALFRKELPIPIRLKLTSTWEESMNKVKSGSCDIIALIAETPSRKQFLSFTKPYITIPFVVVTTQEKFFVSKLELLKDKKLGMHKGYAYVELLKNLYPDMNLIEVNSRQEGLEKVNNGELYGYFSGLHLAGYAIQEGNFTNLKINGQFDELAQVKLGIGVRKEYEPLVGIFNHLIDDIPEHEANRIDKSWRKVQFEVSESYQTITQISVLALILIIIFMFWQFQLRRHNRELEKREKTIWKQANFDFLTKLPNRRLFQDRLEQLVKAHNRQPVSFALILIDLDGFKEINDTLGHDLGDELLIKAAERLQSSIRETDIIARLGGDEFVIILNDIHSESSVEMVAQQLLENLSSPFVLAGDVSHVSASIGITLFPQDCSGDPDGIKLLKNADQAMYAAKRKGKNTFHYFTPKMQQQALNRMIMISDLRHALANHQYQLYFQPILDLNTLSIYKAEALLRWQHPLHGMIAPDQFIPLLEETRMINEVANWVFQQSLDAVKQLHKEFTPKFQLSVNVSPVQFRMLTSKQWPQDMSNLGLPVESAAIEITESMLMEERISGHVSEFRNQGFQVALDDFGVGYSSLSYLRKFPIDYLKIDKSFVSSLDENNDDLALCEAIVTMAHKLKIKVVAEGVETEAQLKLLHKIGCDFAQGFLIAKPLPLSTFKNNLNVINNTLKDLLI